jgi:BASS family bile acid:Na+ symporter
MRTHARIVASSSERFVSALIAIALVVLGLASTVSAGLDVRSDGAPPDRSAIARLVAVNALAVPAAAWAALAALSLSPEPRTALWIVALAPGGASSPLLARSAGASPTTVAWGYFVLAALSPLSLWIAFARSAPALAAQPWTLLSVAAVQVLPLALSAIVGLRFAARAAGAARALRSIGNAALALVIILLLIDRGPMLATLGARTALAMLSLAVITAALGALVARPRAALSTLTVVRNLTLALIVSELSRQRAVAIIVAAYGLVMYLMAAAVTVAARRSHSNR